MVFARLAIPNRLRRSLARGTTDEPTPPHFQTLQLR